MKKLLFYLFILIISASCKNEDVGGNLLSGYWTLYGVDSNTIYYCSNDYKIYIGIVTKGDKENFVHLCYYEIENNQVRLFEKDYPIFQDSWFDFRIEIIEGKKHLKIYSENYILFHYVEYNLEL